MTLLTLAGYDSLSSDTQSHLERAVIIPVSQEAKKALEGGSKSLALIQLEW